MYDNNYMECSASNTHVRLKLAWTADPVVQDRYRTTARLSNEGKIFILNMRS